jgi:hypothetical protein
MKLIKRLALGAIYAIPVLTAHAWLVYLFIEDPQATIVLKRVGYIALGIYLSLWCFLGSLVVISSGLMAIRYLLGIRIKAEISETE